MLIIMAPYSFHYVSNDWRITKLVVLDDIEAFL